MNPRPTSIRALFGKNLRILSNQYPSISEVCRQIDINRAQFNRYLNGESYPRPDMLARICEFFGTDARILTQPLDEIVQASTNLLSHPEMSGFIDVKPNMIEDSALPSGFFRFTRASFLNPEKFISGLLYIYREDGWTFIKGSEAHQTILEQGLPNMPRMRQFKGYIIPIEDGFGALISRRQALTYTFNFIMPVASFNQNFWHGYAVRTINESLFSKRAVRMAYEFLGTSTKEILKTARGAGLCEAEDLPPFHRRLLRIEEPFA